MALESLAYNESTSKYTRGPPGAAPGRPQRARRAARRA